KHGSGIRMRNRCTWRAPRSYDVAMANEAIQQKSLPQTQRSFGDHHLLRCVVQEVSLCTRLEIGFLLKNVADFHVRALGIEIIYAAPGRKSSLLVEHDRHPACDAG